MSEEHKKKIGLANAISKKGVKQTEEHIAKRTKKLIGNKWNVGKKQSSETVEKRRLLNVGKKRSLETKKKISDSHKGKKKPWAKPPVHYKEDNPNWKGGISKENHLIRNSTEYKLWRTAVFTRDKFMCIWGGKEHGSKLNADHIKPFALFPELRFAIDNGRTLCEDCHKKTDTYGWKSVNRQIGDK